jgi:hypothetical protein
MNVLENRIKPYSKAIVKLLKNAPLERKNEKLWNDVINYHKEIQDHIAEIGLELIIKKDEGYAFVRQFEDSEGNTLGLIARRQIGFEATIVLITLRQSLEDFDNNPTQFQVAEKFITNTEIKEEVELFLQEGYNRMKFQKDLDSHINKIVELGYLKEVSRKDNEIKYQIHRIIKEKVTLDILLEFKTKLKEYVESI